jgi:hypothetical protein
MIDPSSTFPPKFPYLHYSKTSVQVININDFGATFVLSGSSKLYATDRLGWCAELRDWLVLPSGVRTGKVQIGSSVVPGRLHILNQDQQSAFTREAEITFVTETGQLSIGWK